jgi:hypothetical protein
MLNNKPLINAGPNPDTSTQINSSDTSNTNNSTSNTAEEQPVVDSTNSNELNANKKKKKSKKHRHKRSKHSSHHHSHKSSKNKSKKKATKTEIARNKNNFYKHYLKLCFLISKSKSKHDKLDEISKNVKSDTLSSVSSSSIRGSSSGFLSDNNKKENLKDTLSFPYVKIKPIELLAEDFEYDNEYDAEEFDEAEKKSQKKTTKKFPNCFSSESQSKKNGSSYFNLFGLRVLSLS